MKRMAMTVLIAALAFSTMGARRRAADPRLQCRALTPASLLINYVGTDTGCSGTNGTRCRAGEVVMLRLATFAYDPSCGPHAFFIHFGDGMGVTEWSVDGRFPVIEHRYQAGGRYRIDATVSNLRTSTRVWRWIEMDPGAF